MKKTIITALSAVMLLGLLVAPAAADHDTGSTTLEAFCAAEGGTFAHGSGNSSKCEIEGATVVEYGDYTPDPADLANWAPIGKSNNVKYVGSREFRTVTSVDIYKWSNGQSEVQLSETKSTYGAWDTEAVSCVRNKANTGTMGNCA